MEHPELPEPVTEAPSGRAPSVLPQVCRIAYRLLLIGLLCTVAWELDEIRASEDTVHSVELHRGAFDQPLEVRVVDTPRVRIDGGVACNVSFPPTQRVVVDNPDEIASAINAGAHQPSLPSLPTVQSVEVVNWPLIQDVYIKDDPAALNPLRVRVDVKNIVPIPVHIDN